MSKKLTTTEWICIIESIPQKEGIYMIYCHGHDFPVKSAMFFQNCHHYWWGDNLKNRNECSFSDDVTHWAKLPDLY